MAPLDSPVHSAHYRRDVILASSQSCTYLVGHTFGSSPKGPSGRLPHKEERRPPCIGLSPVNVENNIKHPRNNGEDDELQHANSHLSYRLLRKNVAAPGNYLVQASAKSVNPVSLTIKTEPNSGNIPCSFFKTLSLDCWPPTRTPNHEHNAGIAIKSESGQNLMADPELEPFNRKDSEEDKATVQGLCDTGKPQGDQISPSISEPQPRRDAHDYPPDESQIQTKVSGAEGSLILSPHNPILVYGSPTNVVRPSVPNQRRIFPYPRFRSYPYLIRVRLPRGNRLLAQVPALPLPNAQPPGDNDNGLPSHQDAPQSSRLYKSLYGLAQCLRSQAGVTVSSLNSTDASNTPVLNQAGPSGSSLSSTNTTEEANNMEQHSIPDAQKTTNELELVDLDPYLIYEYGFYFCSLALQLDPNAANPGMSQDNAPDSVSTAPISPVPLPTQQTELGIHGAFPVVQHVPISGTQLRPQSHFPVPYRGDESPIQQPPASASASRLEIDLTHTGAFSGEESTFVNPNEREGASPNDIVPSQYTASSSSYNGVNSEATPTSSFNNTIGQYLHNFQAAGPSRPELSPPGGFNQAPNPNPRICNWPGCGQKFSRTSLLKGHMYQHDKTKRFRCTFSNCNKTYVHGSGLCRHLNKEHGCSRTSRR